MQNSEELNRANFKQYLLGSLSPTETEIISLQIISDESSEEQFLWAESELMEDYLDKTLTSKELKLFEEKFLISPERHTQLNEISLIRKFARNSLNKESPPIKTELLSNNLFEKLKKYLSLNWRLSAAVFALIIVGLPCLVYLTASRQTVAEREFAEINQSDLSDSTKLQSFTALSLVNGVFRDSGDITKLAESALTERVLFRLALPVHSDQSDKYDFELLKDNKPVFTQEKLPFYSNPNGQEVRLLLPSTVLHKGTFQIKLAKESDNQSTFIYNFAIE